MARSQARIQQNGTPEQIMARLQEEHASLESRLRQLDGLKSLSPEEQYEMQVIKKRKLFLKDQLSDN